MRVRNLFATAIARVGAHADLYREEAHLGSFTASLQPGRLGEPEHDGAGRYLSRQFTLYAPCGGAADLMGRSDTVVLGGDAYYVQEVHKAFFLGTAVYHKARLLPDEARWTGPGDRLEEPDNLGDLFAQQWGEY